MDILGTVTKVTKFCNFIIYSVHYTTTPTFLEKNYSCKLGYLGYLFNFTNQTIITELSL